MNTGRLPQTSKKKIKEAKEMWLAQKCSQIDDLEKTHDTMNLHG